MAAEFRSGDSNEITRRYIDSLLVEMRYINSDIPDIGMELYGERFTSPIMTSAFSHLDKIYKECENGMVEMARGAQAAGAVMWAGMGDDEEMSNMAATGARIVKIIKPYADEDLILHQIKVAEECGALAVGMDIDHSFDKTGHYDNIFGYPMNAKSVSDLRRYAEAAAIPFIVKGVLSAHDAENCLEAGAGGILISHHHGICDYSLPPLMILPEIAKVVKGSIPIFVDCSINRGFDAFKAIALGATAVCVGRIIMQNLARDGYMGVKTKFDEMNDELREVMARTGSGDCKSIDPGIIWKSQD